MLRTRGPFAPMDAGAYYRNPMPSVLRRLSAVGAVTILSLVLVLALFSVPVRAQIRASDGPQTIPVSEIKPGMKGVAYTIFEGDQVEKVDLVVLGVMQNALGPQEDVILVQLLGDKAEHNGVVAGMSGSPVYFDGKLAGAISLKLGIFTKEAIGGVTPIESMR